MSLCVKMLLRVIPSVRANTETVFLWLAFFNKCHKNWRQAGLVLDIIKRPDIYFWTLELIEARQEEKKLITSEYYKLLVVCKVRVPKLKQHLYQFYKSCWSMKASVLVWDYCKSDFYWILSLTVVLWWRVCGGRTAAGECRRWLGRVERVVSLLQDVWWWSPKRTQRLWQPGVSLKYWY